MVRADAVVELGEEQPRAHGDAVQSGRADETLMSDVRVARLQVIEERLQAHLTDEQVRHVSIGVRGGVCERLAPSLVYEAELEV